MLCARVNVFVPSVARGHYETWLPCRRVLSVRLANCTLGWTVQLLRSPSLPFSLCWANCRYFGHQTPVTPRLISSKDQVNVCRPSASGPRLSKKRTHVLPRYSCPWRPVWLCLPERWSPAATWLSIPSSVTIQ
jgi:hypothetical protein